MTYNFSGVIGRANPAAQASVRLALGGAARTIESPFAGFAHCVSPHRFFLSKEERGLLLDISCSFPSERFIWIQVDCVGGVCLQSGFAFGDGAVLREDAGVKDTASSSLLMRLADAMGAPMPSPIFEPFRRGVFEFDDVAWMSRALALARRRLGKVAPNPAVGCVILSVDEVFEGATGDDGRPHAEEIALEAAGAQAKWACAYVSLEPCSARSSERKSCAQLLAEAGLARVVVACEDPNPNASHGVSRLGAAGIEVKLGVLREEAEALNAGFLKKLRSGRPLLAIDADLGRYDAEFDLKREETYEDALDRLGAAGLTRVVVRPGTPLAAQLKARGLVDEER